MTTVEIWIL